MQQPTSNLFTSETGSNRVKVFGALVLLLPALTADVPAVSCICSITSHLDDALLLSGDSEVHNVGMHIRM